MPKGSKKLSLKILLELKKSLNEILRRVES